MSYAAQILLVDDDDNIRKMVRLTLQKEGHDVIEAADGYRGLVLFDDGKEWDLLLLDHRMPGLNGREFVREAKRRDPGARIIMMTSFATIELAAEVMNAGATDFLRKPFSADVVRRAARAALDRPRSPCDPPRNSAEHRTRDAGVPDASHYFNGFDFWTVEEAFNGSVMSPINRTFMVRTPESTICKCVVNVTAHARNQVQEATLRDAPPTDALWNIVCRTALVNYLWSNARMPPNLLPVYELSQRQLEDIASLSVTSDDA